MIAAGLRRALAETDASVRLQAAMTAGSRPQPSQIDVLIEQCRIEPDFYVREMLTWALLHHPASEVLVALRQELQSPIAQARSQALHTLSKIGDPHTRDWITLDHLHDLNDEVARTAWRASTGLTALAALMDLADDKEIAALRDELLSELGRGDFEMKRSLSRALIKLGESIQNPLQALSTDANAEIRTHAAATLRLYSDPESSFTLE